MGDRESLFDTDLTSLERRVARLVGEGAQVVSQFTHWYTTRAAVHEAIIDRSGMDRGA